MSCSSMHVVFAVCFFFSSRRRHTTLQGNWSSDVCSSDLLVVFEPSKVSLNDILKVFWESHDPTQGMRQGNDTGTQYRSAIYWRSEERRVGKEERSGGGGET